MEVLFSEEKFGDKSIGLIELNQPKTLNALSVSMYQLMFNKLEEWKGREDIAALFIHSQNPKAFCAGGDVKSVARAIKENDLAKAQEFFSVEYAFDYYLRGYNKPVIGFAHGYTMGGGVGLLQTTDVRIVSEHSLLSMPEVLIGFFPDVGASQFLQALPSQLGLFMGLTTAKISGSTALQVGFADYCFKLTEKPDVLAQLHRVKWQGNKETDLAAIRSVLTSLSNSAKKNKNIEALLPEIEEICSGSFEQVIEKMQKYKQEVTEEDWISNAIANIDQASPASLKFAHYQLTHKKNIDLFQVFSDEWNIASHFCQHKDFYEGVRSVLIDKDKSPSWEYSKAKDFSEEKAKSFYESSGSENGFVNELKKYTT